MIAIAASEVPVARRAPRSRATGSAAGTMTTPPPIAEEAAERAARRADRREDRPPAPVHARHTTARATRRHAQRGARPAARRPGPRGDPARRRRDARADRPPRRRRRRSPRPRARCSSRSRARYGCVACVSGRRAATARQIVSLGSIAYLGNHGAELLRPGPHAGRARPRGRRVAAPRAPVRRRGVGRRRAAAACACASRTRARSSPSTGAARPTRRPPRRRSRASPSAPRRPGCTTHWGRKVLEVRPPIALDKGRGIHWLLRDADLDAALYVGDDRTDIDAFRGLRELVESGRLEHAVCVGVRSEETPAELEAEADLLVDGTARRARSCCRALVESLHACASSTSSRRPCWPARRRRPRSARSRSPARPPTTTRRCSSFCARLVDDRGGDRRRPRPPRRDDAADRAAARRRARDDDAARAAPPRRGAAQPAVAAARSR